MKLRGLRTLELTGRDIGAVRDWYAGLLGVAPYFDQPFYVGFDVAGYELGVTPREDARPPATTYWATDDVSAAIEEAVARGARLVAAARDVGEDIVIGAVEDPFGNVLGFIENRHFAPRMVAASGLDLRADPIVVTRDVTADPTTCFGAWASSEGMAAWWAQDTRIELRVGGHYELYMLPEARYGARGSEGCRVLSYLPGRMLSFTWNAPPELSRTREQPTWVVLEFEPIDAGTRVRLTHTGWPESAWESEPQWAETHAYFTRAWGYVMGLFEAHFGPAGGEA